MPHFGALVPIVLFFQIDVHYSLPRDDQKGADRERNQVGIVLHSLSLKALS